ncbi:hypothetical protein swp_4404 [Shewanella piezotolerans WP3]|uniref:Uncharacterized protein n=1 Tax=Shewanella piezotolerans (strain WP3 / JCM 13877) TaxID=225849 RepID=B8CTE0_SHEPW|nr:hypothetical protein [Shewanella piezotolerans]ACJ31049.1 hypothetical protein swp_4404 [Shewanella piezotolerans WP3]
MQRLLIVITLLVGFFSVSVLAVDKPEPGQMLAKLTKELNLTLEQQTETEAVMGLFHDEMELLRDSDESRREKGKKMRSAAETRDNKMRQILDEPQFEQYQAMVAEMREQMKQRRKQN